jgi:hypothetical protein
MRTTLHLMIPILVLGLHAGCAQENRSSTREGAIVDSSPGKVSAMADTELKGTVTAVDKATRRVTLKGSQGRMVELLASNEVKNFDQIRVGDNVTVWYQEALSIELRKSKGALGATEVVGTAHSATPGERPVTVVGREVQVTAEVVNVDPVKSIISLKGPRGNVVDLKVKNPDHFKVVKTGDLVDAVYTEARAIAFSPSRQ